MLTRLVWGAVVAAVTAGSVLLADGVAGATVPAGTLGTDTIEPATGTDQSAMQGTTSGPCPVGTLAINQTIVGPVDANGQAPDATATFPDSNPFPVTGTTGSKAAYSTRNAFTTQWSDTLVDDANLRGKTIQPGEYHIVLNCTDELGPAGQQFGTFTGGLIFSDAHNYTVIPNGTGTATPTVSPTSAASPTPTVSPIPVASPTPAASPTPTTPTDSPTPTTSTTPDGSTTTPTTNMNGSGDTTTPSDTGGGTQPLASTGALANTGAPIAAMFLGGVLLLAAGLALVVWRRRPRSGAGGRGRHNR